MPPAAIGYWHMEAEKLIVSFENPTVQDFNQYPELAIDVLVLEIWIRSIEISPPGKGAELTDDLLQVLWDWVYCGQPLDGWAGIEPACLLNRKVAVTQTRKRGRPIKSRHMAIKALFRREYLNRTWEEVTRLLCQCGQPHDDKQKLKRCQDNMGCQVRNLRQVLREHGIAFPPKRTKEELSACRKLEVSQSKPQERNVPTLEESSGALRVTSEYAIPHPAIAILLDGPPPIMNCDSDRGDESGAWSLFNPWVRGWIPIWFPTLIGTEAPWSEEEYQRLRYNCFDKVFKRFAGSDWPPRGSLDSQRRAMKRILLDLYCAVAAEQWLKIDDLRPLEL